MTNFRLHCIGQCFDRNQPTHSDNNQQSFINRQQIKVQMHFPQRISSIQSKVRQIHGQLQPPQLGMLIDGPEGVPSLGSRRTTARRRKGMFSKLFKQICGKNKNGAFKCCAHRQIFYAQCLKLVALFAVAIAHLLFLHPFLELFSQLEKYVAHLDYSSGTELARYCVHELTDYKKNVWMTVAVLCIGLSTSSFFLFLLPSSSPVRKGYVYLIGLIDLVSFGCLPALFVSRASTIHQVQSQLNKALEQAHRVSSAEKLMNELQCTIQPREKLPFCSDVILRTMFPNNLVKVLLVICAVVLAYLGLAYLIYWCIKHWVPHSPTSSYGGKLCPCCAHQQQLAADSCSNLSSTYSEGRKSGGGGRLGVYSPLDRSPKFFAYSPPPPLVVVPNPLAFPSEQCSPVSAPATPIPTEPIPPEVAAAK